MGLLGTRYTMEEDFLINRLKENHLAVSIPSNKKEIEDIDTIIFEELCKGILKPSSKERYLELIKHMIEESHIEGIILGCTEIEMLIKQDDLSIPVFDTTQAHINAIVAYCLGEKE